MLGQEKSKEAACLSAFSPPIRVTQPRRAHSPLIFASPHSGHIYPDAFVSRSRLPLSELRRNEDAYIDTLFSSAPHQGAPLLQALFPRCFVDVNRAPDELSRDYLPAGRDTTLRARMGLGVVPSQISENRPIYKRPLKAGSITRRIDALYHPYHDALQTLTNKALNTFGRAIIIDCHSMPGFNAARQRRADFILGDRYGTSCHPDTIDCIQARLMALGYSVSRNHPYAGGFVTSHYGQPNTGVETIQIEINRDLYLNPVKMTAKSGYDQLARNLQTFIGQLIEDFSPRIAIAAE